MIYLHLAGSPWSFQPPWSLAVCWGSGSLQRRTPPQQSVCQNDHLWSRMLRDFHQLELWPVVISEGKVSINAGFLIIVLLQQYFSNDSVLRKKMFIYISRPAIELCTKCPFFFSLFCFILQYQNQETCLN